jgi:hypoxanthine phosphoribosyltransferase
MEWHEVVSDVRRLALLINNTHFHPNYLIAVARGGWVPTRILSDLLNVKRIASIGIRYADKDRNTPLTYSLPDPIVPSDTVLLVEDMLETGASLTEAKRIIISNGASVKTAALYYTDDTIERPDFSLGPMARHIIFPWEVRPLSN